MKQYYALLNTNELVYLGTFLNFHEAWEYADYEMNMNFVWIFKDINLKKLCDSAYELLDKNEVRSVVN